MNKYPGFYTTAFTSLIILLSSCHSKNVEELVSGDIPETITPVTVVAVSTGAMEEVIELNATSAFQQKWIVKSNLNGYLQQSRIALNQFVSKGTPLFSLKTKEAQSIGNSINSLDSTFRFSGVNSIRANGNGFISEVNHQAGDYIQDGEQLAVITDTKSFVFLLNLPYEMRPYLSGKTTVELMLPDGEKLIGILNGSIPVMDSISQTQQIVLKVNTTHLIPENLIAKVRLVKNKNTHAAFLPRAAVLADETQRDFWVMKMINDSTAVKVGIKKGIESGEQVEIILPVFSPEDRLVVTGNYGLADTAKVKLVSHQ